MIIRPLKPEDYPQIHYMWKSQHEIPPELSAMPLESTFVLEIDDKVCAALSIILTNCKEYVLFENFVADWRLRGATRKEGVDALIQFAENFSRALKYKKFLCLSPSKSLTRLYRRYGAIPTLSGVTTMIKNL